MAGLRENEVQHNQHIAPEVLDAEGYSSHKVRTFSEILYRSFEFSQGVPRLQGKIFTYLHLRRTDWFINPNERRAILSLVGERVKKRFFPDRAETNLGFSLDPTHTDVAYGNITQEVSARARSMAYHVNKPAPRTEKKLEQELLRTIRDISQYTILADYDHLVIRGGRPRKNLYPHTSRYHPYASYLYTFAGSQPAFFIPEFSLLFSDVRDYTRAQVIGGIWKIDPNPQLMPSDFELEQVEYGRALSLIAQTWEKTHGRDYFDVFDLPIA